MYVHIVWTNHVTNPKIIRVLVPANPLLGNIRDVQTSSLRVLNTFR